MISGFPSRDRRTGAYSRPGARYSVAPQVRSKSGQFPAVLVFPVGMRAPDRVVELLGTLNGARVTALARPRRAAGEIA